jgi:hypothetical protein
MHQCKHKFIKLELQSNPDTELLYTQSPLHFTHQSLGKGIPYITSKATTNICGNTNIPLRIITKSNTATCCAYKELLEYSAYKYVHQQFCIKNTNLFK